MLNLSLKRIILLLSTINLIIASSLGYHFIYHYIIFIIICAIIQLAELMRMKKSTNTIFNRITNVVNVTSKVFFLAGFFILTVNVFVLKVGVKSCESCGVASVMGIVGAAFYLCFYFVFFWLATGESYGRLLVNKL